MIPTLDTVSVTELSSFRDCRRAWYLGNVRKLVSRTPIPALWFGTLIHAALETYFRDGKNIEKTLQRYADEYTATERELVEGYGFLWEGAKQEYYDLYTLGKTMLTNYESFDKANEHRNWETVSVEERVWVPIKSSTGRGTLKGTPRLTARMDLLVGVTDDIYIVDHKTSAYTPDQRALEMDDQLTGYAYVYWRLTGELPRMLIYDTLIKSVPQEPRILKDGSISRDKSQATTYGAYLKAIEDAGGDPSMYAEVLDGLRAKGWNPWFMRVGTARNIQQVLSYQEHLYFTFQEMRACVKDPRLAYPNPSQMRCPRCPYLQVCTSMDDGGDAEAIIANTFNVNEEPRW